MTDTPQVSVLMPVYNAEQFLPQAIESILTQTFTNFEFLIVEDGSRDKTPEIIRSYDDPRIRIIQNPHNMGITRSLNKGLGEARGQYIARMDADDISLPHRLSKQVQFMDANPTVGLMGTNMLFINEAGDITHEQLPVYTAPMTPFYLRWKLIWNNPMMHPTVMMRREVLNTYHLNYDEAFPASEDNALWVEIAKHADLAVLDEVCLHYRILSTSISRTNTEKQLDNTLTLMRRQLQALFRDKPSAMATSTIWDAIYQTEHPPYDYLGAAALVTRAHKVFYAQANAADRKRLNDDLVQYLDLLYAHATRTGADASIVQQLAREIYKRTGNLTGDSVFKRVVRRVTGR